MHRHFARWSLRRRIVALAAAYAIALGSVLASWAAGSAAALATAGPATIICHSEVTGETAPSQNDNGGNVCIGSCCVGCVLLIASLPPPPVKAIDAPQTIARPLAPTLARIVPAQSSTRSHQSRAPPLRA